MAFREMFQQLKKLFQELSPAKKVTLFSLTAGTLAGLFFLMTWTEKMDYRYLYSNIDPEDAGEILAELKDRKIPYQISGNGKSIMIPKDQVHEIRMDLASKGIPKSTGIGFEIFDNTKLGMTEFVQKVNYQRALQGELCRTINKIPEVESSRVHIVMAPKSLFIEKETPVTASVIVKMHRGRWLNQGQVQGIVHLVSSSVSRLKPANVTVVDGDGRILAGEQAKEVAGNLTPDELGYQEKMERGLEGKIKMMLGQALGDENATVKVSVALDFKRQEMKEEKYYPENRVIRSEQMLNETSIGSKTNPAGIPGTRSNLAKRTDKKTGEDKTEFQKVDRTVNYEIGKITSHIVEPTARVKRISAAVIIDGTYQRVAKEAGLFEWKYIPRAADEIEKIKNIVKGAINFDASRGDMVEVANIPFEMEKVMKGEEKVAPIGWLDRLREHQDQYKYMFLGIFLFFSFLFIVRPLIKWLTGSVKGDMQFIQQLPMTVGEIENGYSGGGLNMPNRDELNRLLSGDSEVTANVIREWAKEG